MFVKYETSDNAFGKLSANVNTTQTTISLSSSQNLPTGVKTWIGTLTQYAVDGTVGKFEKIKVTNNVSGTLTVVRGFDGTTAETFNQDDYIFLNVVSAIIKDLQEQAENPVKWEFKNQSGSTIPVFRVVQATGALGASGKMTAAPFLADGSVSQIYALGISRTSVANGDDGEALAFGKIHGINTTGSIFSETWAEGDVLYCSPTVAGGLTKVKPGPTHLAIPIAMIINVHANNGTIAVRVPDTFKLGELHDVSFASLATGDSIFRHASGYWYNSPAYTKAQIDAKINAVNGIAGLNGSGQLDPSVLPVLATTETVIVTDQTAMLALTSGQVQKGDVAVHSGGSQIGTRWLFGGGTISDINNWILLADTTPERSVIAGKPTTVAGYGISDVYTKIEVNSSLALKANLAGGNSFSGVQIYGSNTEITGGSMIKNVGYSDTNAIEEWGDGSGNVRTRMGRTANNEMYMSQANFGSKPFQFRGSYDFINSLRIRGTLQVYDNTGQSKAAGLVTEVQSENIGMGVNDGVYNRFGLSYTPSQQGGIIRVDSRADQPLFSFLGRQAGVSGDVSTLLSLTSSGLLTVNGQDWTNGRTSFSCYPVGGSGGTYSGLTSSAYYKIIGKICFVKRAMGFNRNTLAGRPRVSLPFASSSAGIGEDRCCAIMGGIGTKGSNEIGMAVMQGGVVEWLNGIGQAGDWSSYPSTVYSSGNICYEIA